MRYLTFPRSFRPAFWLLIALPLVVVGWLLTRPRDIVREIRQLGGTAEITSSLPTWDRPFRRHALDASLAGTEIDDAWLAKRAGGFGQFRAVSLSLRNTQVTDEGLPQLKPMTNLLSLDLSYTHVTDNGMDQLSSMPRLGCLDLSGTRVSDEGLKELAKMPGQIKTLCLDQTNVTDAGLSHLRNTRDLTGLHLDASQMTARAATELAQMRDLEFLLLIGPDVTDAVIANVTQVTRLKYLTLVDGNVTPEGLEELKSLPRLKRVIVWDSQMTDEEVGGLRAKLPGVAVRRHSPSLTEVRP